MMYICHNVIASKMLFVKSETPILKDLFLFTSIYENCVKMFLRMKNNFKKIFPLVIIE